MNIYQIEQSYLSITDQIIESGGELTPELETALAINKAELENKARNYGFVVKSLENDVSNIDEEIKRLNALKLSRNKAIDVLKDTVKNAMIMYGIEEIKTSTLKLSFRKSESVELDPSLLDFKWMNQKISYTPDKAKIKESIKSGEAVPGAWINVNNNLQIK
jgi:hypothetical protein